MVKIHRNTFHTRFYRWICVPLFVLFFLSTGQLHAGPKTDSLETALRKAEGKERLAILSKLVSFLRRPDPNKSKSYFDAFEKLYFELKEPLEYKSRYYHNKGEMHLRGANYKEAVRSLLLAVEWSEKNKEYDMLWASYNSLGGAYQEQADLNNTLVYFLKAYEVARSHLDEGSAAGSAINIGVIYGEQQQFKEALKYFRYSCNYHAKFGAGWGLGNCLNNIGQVHMLSGDADSALYYFTKAMGVWMKVSDDYGIAMTSFNLATLHLNAKRFEEAETEYLKSLAISEKINDQYGITQNLAALCSLYSDWEKDDKAQLYLQRSIEYSKKNNILASLRDSYRMQYRFLKKENDFKSALEAYENYFYWYDSLNNADKTKNLQELQSKFETADKEKEIIRQKAEIDKQQTQRNFLVAGIVLVLFSLALVFRNYRLKKKANVVITLQKEEVERQKALVDEKQKEILDSIQYARRIQQSLLPNERYIERVLQTRYNKKA